MQPKIGIIGGTGYIGNSLTSILDNYKIFCRSKKQKDSNVFNGDIQNFSDVKHFLKSVDILINLSGQYSDNLDFLNSNSIGMINIARACKICNVKNLLHFSTINVYGDNLKYFDEKRIPKPNTYYSKIKYLSEEILKSFSDKYNLDITIFRLSNIYGNPQQNGIISNLINSLVNSKSILISHNGNQYRDFFHIDDLLTVIRFFIENPMEGFNIFNLCSSNSIKIKDLIKIINKNSLKKLDVNFSETSKDEKYISASNFKLKKYTKISNFMNITDGVIRELKNNSLLR